MVDFIKKRLQVFISSTYKDLILERQAAVEAILMAGHIPAGMELFTSGDESQMEVIKQWIQESDVFLLILGGKYGSVEPTSNKSYTQLEYEYAVSLGKPLFACVITEPALENNVKTLGSAAMETTYSRELSEFRELVLSKMVKFWEDCKDIKIVVGETLWTFASRDGLIGWVRATQEANVPALADEIARLSKENAELRSVISNSSEKALHELSYSETKAILIKKNLLDKFYSTRQFFKCHNALSRNQLQISEVEINELVMLNLIKYVSFNITEGNYYSFTDIGRVFLNKMEVEQLA